MLIAVFTILQCTVLNYLHILKTKPDILLILIIFFSLYYGGIYGMVVGAVCGLFTEATCGIPSGFFVFTYSLGGLILSRLGKWIYIRKILSQICTAFIFCFMVYSFLFLFFCAFNAELSLFNAVTSIILPASFYTAAVSPVVFWFLKTVFNHASTIAEKTNSNFLPFANW